MSVSLVRKNEGMRRLPAILALMAASFSAAGQEGAEPSHMLEPLPPEVRWIAPLADLSGQPTAVELRERAEARNYARQIRSIRYRYFGRKKYLQLRQEGIEQLREFTDPATFLPMIEALRDEQDDVRLALLDHFAKQGDWGQAALTWVALHEMDPAFNYEALKRLSPPASGPTLSVIDQGLRSRDDYVANLAGKLAGHLEIYDAIPLLIHGQSREGNVLQTGDDAWILVGTQKVYIAALIPIVGDNSGAFQPIPGILTEGVILRVVEAVAMIYRTEIHYTLVAMTTQDWGRSTADFGYDKQRWAAWYNNEYLPYKNTRARAEKLAAEHHQKLPPKDDPKGGNDGDGGN